jgi:hypothetical protein
MEWIVILLDGRARTIAEMRESHAGRVDCGNRGV